MLLGILVEPEACHQQRVYEQRQRQAQEARQRLARMDDLRTQLIFDALREKSDEPLLITQVVNWVAKRLNYSTNQDRVGAKLALFPKISWLIKIGRLQRVQRNAVSLPESDQKERAYLAAMDARIKNLPEPRL
jgi:hypothetical protein